MDKWKKSIEEHGYYTGDVFEILDKTFNFEQCIKSIEEIKKTDLHQYRATVIGHSEIPHRMSWNEIDWYRETIKKNNYKVYQQWHEFTSWEPLTKDNTVSETLKNAMKKFMAEVYPQYDYGPDSADIGFTGTWSMYEQGDFIQDHQDGNSPGRICVFLIYLSDPTDYNDAGGELVIENKVTVQPLRGNFAVLDFTKFNPRHEVKPVKADFTRYCYICFAAEFDKKSWQLENERKLNEKN
jgi:Rps23 Pro-64 3,4-dihydroxylase Tpa1-like proline 4-hydroxylase